MDKLKGLLLASALIESVTPERKYQPIRICKRANQKKKCKYSGRCDGTKHCKFAIYD